MLGRFYNYFSKINVNYRYMTCKYLNTNIHDLALWMLLITIIFKNKIYIPENIKKIGTNDDVCSINVYTCPHFYTGLFDINFCEFQCILCDNLHRNKIKSK